MGSRIYLFCIGPQLDGSPFRDTEVSILGILASHFSIRLESLHLGQKNQADMKAWAHDLMKPFGIKGATNRLINLLNYQDSETLREIPRFAHAVREELSFINNYLTRIVGGETISMETIEISDLISTVIKRCQTSEMDRGITILKDVPEKKVYVNVERNIFIYRVFMNLVDNARRHTPPGGVITLSAQFANLNEVQFAVHNTGNPIPLEDVEHLFDAGFQGEGEKGAAGLGLYSVKSTIENCGGRVWVENVDGEGVSFFFTLPVASPGGMRGTGTE